MAGRQEDAFQHSKKRKDFRLFGTGSRMRQLRGIFRIPEWLPSQAKSYMNLF
jgi:hypothetical protein